MDWVWIRLTDWTSHYHSDSLTQGYSGLLSGPCSPTQTLNNLWVGWSVVHKILVTAQRPNSPFHRYRLDFYVFGAWTLDLGLALASGLSIYLFSTLLLLHNTFLGTNYILKHVTLRNNNCLNRPWVPEFIKVWKPQLILNHQQYKVVLLLSALIRPS